MTGPVGSLLEQARAVQERTVALRRDLHRRPELGLDLPHTRQAVVDALAGLPLELRYAEGCSAVYAVLEGARPGRTVILRGDMDALPMSEHTAEPFASEVDGAMHACGHDTHVAMLASAVRLLCARRDELVGRVGFFFQPGEEGHHGAKVCLDEGLLGRDGRDADGHEVAGVFALHISSSYPTGQLLTRPGAIMASADQFHVRIHGRGGHASAPRNALDPVPVAAEAVLALQSMVTRRVDIFDPAVVTVGRLVAGTTDNVIPPYADLDGTVRTLSEDTRTAVLERVGTVFAGVAAAHGTTADVRLVPGYPVTVNDADAAGSVLAVAADLVGPRDVVVMDTPIMGAEDWSYVLQEHRGVMAFLGACPPDQDPLTVAPNHSDRVVFDEDAMVVGVAMHAAVALHWLDGRRDD